MEKERYKIDKLVHMKVLRKGDIFGEISMLTSLKRTCTIISKGYMIA